MAEAAVVATIGYEAADLSDFIATLKLAEIRTVIDVRELPISRRRGFAKRALSEVLGNSGIRYVHLRGLGDPKEGREAARRGDFARFMRVFSRHMVSEVAQTDLKLAVDLVAQGGGCLMCYERDHSTCHRSIVAKAIADIIPVAISHLGVRQGVGRYRDHNQQLDFAVEATA